jgi:chromosome segregation ATPase
MAEKKSTISDKDSLEVCRQVLKQNEFWVRCQEIFAASVVAQANLDQKRAAAEAEERRTGELKLAGEKMIADANSEVRRIKENFEQQHADNLRQMESRRNQRAKDLGDSISALEEKNEDLSKRCAQVTAEIEKIQNVYADEVTKLQRFRAQAEKEREAIEKEKSQQQKILEDQLNSLRSMIGALRTGIQQLPS